MVSWFETVGSLWFRPCWFDGLGHKVGEFEKVLWFNRLWNRFVMIEVSRLKALKWFMQVMFMLIAGFLRL